MSQSQRDLTTRAVLFDRDGTLVHDVPCHGDPERVVAIEGARAAVARLRESGLLVAVVTNQSAVGSGRLSRAEVDAVNARIDALLGPFHGWFVCTHARGAGCRCRTPSPGLILSACDALGVRTDQAVVIGDVAADMVAAAGAGARGILVPTPATRRSEILAAWERAVDLAAAVTRILGEPALEARGAS